MQMNVQKVMTVSEYEVAKPSGRAHCGERLSREEGRGLAGGVRAWAQGPRGSAGFTATSTHSERDPVTRGQWTDTHVSPQPQECLLQAHPDGEQQTQPRSQLPGAGSSLSSLEQEPQDGTSTLLRELKQLRKRGPWGAPSTSAGGPPSTRPGPPGKMLLRGPRLPSP